MHIGLDIRGGKRGENTVSGRKSTNTYEADSLTVPSQGGDSLGRKSGIQTRILTVDWAQRVCLHLQLSSSQIRGALNPAGVKLLLFSPSALREFRSGPFDELTGESYDEGLKSSLSRFG